MDYWKIKCSRIFHQEYRSLDKYLADLQIIRLHVYLMWQWGHGSVEAINRAPLRWYVMLRLYVHQFAKLLHSTEHFISCWSICNTGQLDGGWFFYFFFFLLLLLVGRVTASHSILSAARKNISTVSCSLTLFLPSSHYKVATKIRGFRIEWRRSCNFFSLHLWRDVNEVVETYDSGSLVHSFLEHLLFILIWAHPPPILHSVLSLRSRADGRNMGTYLGKMGQSLQGVMGEFSRMTHHLYCISLRGDLPCLNAQGQHSFIGSYTYLIIACWLVNCA
jgi:hypothetical protein